MTNVRMPLVHIDFKGSSKANHLQILPPYLDPLSTFGTEMGIKAIEEK